MARSDRRQRRRGAAMIETAVTLGIFLVFLMGIFEYGRYLMIRNLLDNAARAGARQAVASTTASPSPDIQATAFNALAGQPLLNSGGLPLSKTDIQVYRANPATGQPMTDSYGSTWTNAIAGESIAVQINGSYKPILPTLGTTASSFPVKVTVVMTCEGN